jgi:hypothetical protein
MQCRWNLDARSHVAFDITLRSTVADSALYRMTIELNVLEHLGIGLYSNIPSVISETVANSWDADARHVSVTIDQQEDTVTIEDDGLGMSRDEVNTRYLKVGYQKRSEEGVITAMGRHVMGRKGIGKLALFSIAETIEIHTTKMVEGDLEKSGLVMSSEAIRAAIASGSGDYHPEAVDDRNTMVAPGTKILLRDLRAPTSRAESYLRRRLARRFSVIGVEHEFEVDVDGEHISVEDRDFFPQIQYVWCIGDGSDRYAGFCKNAKRTETLAGDVDADAGYRVSGWIGTFDEQKHVEEGNNAISVLAWGKVIHEDILGSIKEGGIYTKYLVGELRADFLDQDDAEDIATSGRQSVKETDPRFEALRAFVHSRLLKRIENKWGDWRKEDATEQATMNPAVKAWFDGLGRDNKKYAERLFAKIESFPVSDPEYKRTLYKHSILAFETLALQENLTALDSFESPANLSALTEIFRDIDALEQVHYHSIVKGRLGVIEKLAGIVDDDDKEKVIQAHVYDHLWLLDPSWERASTNKRIEETVTKEFEAITSKLSEEERRGRIDIRYRTAAGKHIIVELKRYSRTLNVYDLAKQISKYRRGLQKCLLGVEPDVKPVIECVCVLGSPPDPSDDQETVHKILTAESARFVTYDGLIASALASYGDYLEANKDAERVMKIVESI